MNANCYELRLVGGFTASRGNQVIALTPGASRLTAFLVCNGGTLRSIIAEMLWPNLSEGRALANLRSALWRLHRSCPNLVGVTKQGVRLDDAVQVDLTVATRLAFDVIEGRMGADDLRRMTHSTWLPLTCDVLPDWYDEWILIERERYRQLRLHALEFLATAFIRGGRLAEAIDVANAAIRGEPLRESSHRVLIQAHQSEGNHVEAMRAYKRCRQLLLHELGVRPTPQLERLIAPSLAPGMVLATSL